MENSHYDSGDENGNLTSQVQSNNQDPSSSNSNSTNPEASNISQADPQNVVGRKNSPIENSQTQPQHPEETPASSIQKRLRTYLFAWQSLLAKGEFSDDHLYDESKKFLQENELLK